MVKTVQAKPIKRSPETERITAVSDQAALWRVVRGAPRNAKAIRTKANGIDRREQAVMELGAELSRLLACTADRSGSGEINCQR